MKKSLLSLAFGTFALGIVEFGMMGFLNDISANIGAVALFTLYNYEKRNKNEI